MTQTQTQTHSQTQMLTQRLTHTRTGAQPEFASAILQDEILLHLRNLLEETAEIQREVAYSCTTRPTASSPPSSPPHLFCASATQPLFHFFFLPTSFLDPLRLVFLAQVSFAVLNMASSNPSSLDALVRHTFHQGLALIHTPLFDQAMLVLLNAFRARSFLHA